MKPTSTLFIFLALNKHFVQLKNSKGLVHKLNSIISEKEFRNYHLRLAESEMILLAGNSITICSQVDTGNT